MIRTLSLLALAVLAASGFAQPIVIDTFEQGYHLATITGQGNKSNLATGLDRNEVFAGHRQTNYVVSGNPFGYTTTFEVGLGEARVTTPGPNDLSTELYLEYGDFEPMNFDLSWFQGDGPLFEVDLGTDPPDLFAEVWSINVTDGQGRSTRNGQFGTIEGGIQFRKDGFVGNPNFDWSDVDKLTFRQKWNAQNTAPLAYWATEMRAVPEPSTVALLAASLVAAAKRFRSQA
jgi:hypothetical protein